MLLRVATLTALLPALFLFFGEHYAFKQNDYRVIVERSEVIRYSNECLANLTFAYSVYNRTTRAFNFKALFLKDVNSGLSVVGDSFKFLSNEYRPFPMRIPIDLCREMESPRFGLDDIKKHSNLGKCPFKKGWYYISNYSVDYTKFPPRIPFGRYKIEANFYHHSKFVLEMHFFAKVEQIIKW